MHSSRRSPLAPCCAQVGRLVPTCPDSRTPPRHVDARVSTFADTLPRITTHRSCGGRRPHYFSLYRYFFVTTCLLDCRGARSERLPARFGDDQSIRDSAWRRPYSMRTSLLVSPAERLAATRFPPRVLRVKPLFGSTPLFLTPKNV